MDLPTTTVPELVDRYDGLLLDSHGVLVTDSGATPGAPGLIAYLDDSGTPFRVVSNTCASLPESASARYRRHGMDVAAEQVITAGSLLPEHFAARGLRDHGVIVLGPPDAVAYVERAGGQPTGPDDVEASVVVVGDEAGFPFVEAVTATLTTLVHRLDRGMPVHLVSPNADLIFPAGAGRIGFTAGAVAALIDACLRSRYGDDAPRFVTLGKPHRALFDRACTQLGTRDLVMLGDQLATDIRGALDAGLDAALVTTGLYTPASVHGVGDVRPTWLLPSLAPGHAPRTGG